MKKEAMERAIEQATKRSQETGKTWIVLDKEGKAGKIMALENYDPNHPWMEGYKIVKTIN